MTPHVIRAAELVRVPWKNGGGTTSEISVFPHGAGFDTFGWRISMADVAMEGPFSAFPGVDRTLIVMEGGNIELTVGGVPFRLKGPSDKLSFSGDDPTTCRLLSGPIRDLNVMTRRGQFRHRTRTLEAGTALLAEDAHMAFITPLNGRLNVTLGGTMHALETHDTLMLPAWTDLIPLSGPGRAVLIEITPD
ncbi:HutD/Ves family protein [Microvirga rosea]|uniref:HutD/Ves family protein n=1 Tax=Microvirga rosea TaxID=2715425 RepID=UPI001D0BA78B|nr:HutD family protein [Microvirga rosea]MCB8822147.1 HutD family protein [Microvirga rosea]